MSDERIVDEIYRGLPGPARDRTRCVPVTPGAAEIKAIAAELDAAISGRMHFSIACLGSCTPVASFEYQDKFSGLYELFDLRGLCVPGEGSDDSSEVLRLAEHLFSQADATRNAIHRKLPSVRRLAQRNIDALLGENVA
jgi:polysaccharide pyruvyl transferase WcaK-like protein